MLNSVFDRFWSKVRITPGCWFFPASPGCEGYGKIYTHVVGSKIVKQRAHRFSWELHNGSIPEGLCVLHKCDNRTCVNPEHLFLGTKGDNNKDCKEKGRYYRKGKPLLHPQLSTRSRLI